MLIFFLPRDVSDTVTEVLGGRGWIIPNLLDQQECNEIVQLGENFGIHHESKSRGRTSARTNNYINEELTVRINSRLTEELLLAVESTPPYTSVRGIHPNWRVARYIFHLPLSHKSFGNVADTMSVT